MADLRALAEQSVGFVEEQDRASFECLLRRYQHEIYNYLRRYLGDENMAEDAFQLTFVRVYQKAHQFDLSRRFRPWLYSVATNQAIDEKRKLGLEIPTGLDQGQFIPYFQPQFSLPEREALFAELAGLRERVGYRLIEIDRAGGSVRKLMSRSAAQPVAGSRICAAHRDPGAPRELANDRSPAGVRAW